MKTHDLTGGYFMDEERDGRLTFRNSWNQVRIELSPAESARLRAIVLSMEEIEAEERRDAEIADRERGVDQILDYRDRTGI